MGIDELKMLLDEKDGDPATLFCGSREITTLSERLQLEAELQAARREVLDRLALAAEYRDDQTGGHTKRVGFLSAQIALALGRDEMFAESIQVAALLHDVGKIGIPDRILLKAGRLDAEEWSVMKGHTTIGGRILEGCNEPVMQMAYDIAMTHHERWDGSGYPYGLAGPDIPLVGRIVAVADSYDAMTSARPYKRAQSHEWALAEILAMSGKQFDPLIVSAFLRSQRSGQYTRCVVEA